MATTTNFGWETPDDTDLVKDGALAMRTLGNAIDASMVDLKGGTTGQVLSKASNTDMDFTWVAQDDSNAIQNAIVDAKGDLIAASAADTPARLAVGNNGETLVADSSASTGLRWQGNFAAGKNKVINGDFGIWQRGTSFTTGSGYQYTADRWLQFHYGTNTASCTQQTFTPGTAPVAGYEGQFFGRFNSTNTATFVSYRIEDVRTLAGQTAILSFWAKSNSNQTLSGGVWQGFGSGGSANVQAAGISQAITTSWARYSVAITFPSVSGKTIGSSSYVFIEFVGAINNALDLWGVQLEAGNVATAFQTATGTLAGELAACQRYFFRHEARQPVAIGEVRSSTLGFVVLKLPVTMRTTASASYGSASGFFFNSQGKSGSPTALATDVAGKDCFGIQLTFTGYTAGQAAYFDNVSSTIDFSAEL